MQKVIGGAEFALGYGIDECPLPGPSSTPDVAIIDKARLLGREWRNFV